MQDWCSGNIAAFQAVVASSNLVSCSNSVRLHFIKHLYECWIGVVVTCDLAKVESRVQISYLTPLTVVANTYI